MGDEGKYTREEIQDLIRQACDDASTQAVALFTEHIKEWIRSWFRKLAMQLLMWLWKPVVLALAISAIFVVYELREYL